jgi:hypothetical protein
MTQFTPSSLNRLDTVRCGISQENHRVLGIRTDYDRHNRQYDQRLTLTAP